MFGVVGALILSREPRNVIGGLLLYGAFTTAVSFTGGEIAHLAHRTWLDGPLAQLLGLLSGLGWLVGILPVVFLLPLLFPDGHLPSPRWKCVRVASSRSRSRSCSSASSSAIPCFTGSTEAARIPNPLYISAIGTVDDPRRRVRDRLLRVLRGLGGLAVRALPGVDRHRAPADQVGRVRLPGGVPRDRARRPHPAAHGERARRRARLHGVPRGDRRRRAAIPPLRPRRRGPQDGRSTPRSRSSPRSSTSRS